jgi:hypothetical protein
MDFYFSMEYLLQKYAGIHNISIMSIDELYLIENVITGEDRDLESGDNPE